MLHHQRFRVVSISLVLSQMLIGIFGIGFSVLTLANSGLKLVYIEARNSKERTENVLQHGLPIEIVEKDRVATIVDELTLRRLRPSLKISQVVDIAEFPKPDDAYHTYEELVGELKKIEEENPEIAKLHSIGKTVEGKELFAIQLNASDKDRKAGRSDKPGVLFTGAHHAREHLSVEIPLLLIQHLVKNKKSSDIGSLLATRDIWILPMVNPDGAEYDIAQGRYLLWRKNRQKNKGGTFGVDLNRNYGYKWNHGGSSSNPSSDIYHGPTPFSEPETQALRDFVTARTNLRIVLDFHTFSELVLYPWGWTNDSVENERDRRVFEKMAKVMAQANGYTPMPASELYIASGDSSDFYYGGLQRFGFTFELSPKSMTGGGFYPGPKIIVPTFEKNLRPCLYLLENAEDPYKVIESEGETLAQAGKK